MQWVSRAGPSRVWATRRPSPIHSSTLSSSTSSPVNSSSQCPPCSSGPMIPIRRTMRQPGWSRWNRNAVRPAPRIVRGARDQDEMRGAVRAGDEPFAPGDDPLAVAPLGAGADHAGIGAAARRRLGHGEGRAHLAVDDRPQPALLLRRRAGAREQVHVAVVGRHAIEGERTEIERAASSYIAAQATIGSAMPPNSLGDCGAHSPAAFAFARTGARRSSGMFSCSAKFARSRLQRQHVLLDKGARAQPDVLEFRWQREIHLQPRSATIWPPSTTMVVPAMKLPASEPAAVAHRRGRRPCRIGRPECRA